MKNAGNKCWPFLFKLFLFLVLPLQVSPGYSATIEAPAPAVTCYAPDAWVSSQGSTSVQFSWAAVSGATSYQVWYYYHEGQVFGTKVNTSGTSVQFQGLAAGTYTFYFVSFCSEGSSEPSIVDDLMMG